MVKIKTGVDNTTDFNNAPTHRHHQVTLSWRNVTFSVPVQKSSSSSIDTVAPSSSSSSSTQRGRRTLLHDMSGIARAGRVLAIMGPSGAGKTTLMSALAGRLKVDSKANVLEGSCEVNGVPFINSYTPLLSVVAQDDIVMGKETPRDALLFSAQMRLGLSKEEAKGRVNAMLRTLRLEKCADTFIGVPGAIKGISGGEKKRVNIGCELISDPSIVIMDEPTTGLDSVNAARIGTLMRDLAHIQKRTVICTVHTPSSELFDTFDDLLLLAKGHVIYHGPREGAVRYFASVLNRPVPPHTNPIEHYMDVLQLGEEEGLGSLWQAWESHVSKEQQQQTRARGSSFNDCILDFPRPSDPSLEASILDAKCRQHASQWHQFTLLYKRAMRMYRRDPMGTFGRFVLTCYVATLLGLFFFKVNRWFEGVMNLSGVLFIVTVNNTIFSMMPGVMMFPLERAIFLTEQSASMYHPAVYSIARILAESPINIIFPSVYSSIVYFMVNLRQDDTAHFFIFFLIINLVSLVGFSLGMFSSAVFPRLEAAMAFGPVLLMPISIVAGLFANTARLTPYWTWLCSVSFLRYGYSALVVNEFRDRSLCPPDEALCLYQNGDEYLALIGFSDWEWQTSAWRLALFVVFFWTVSIAALTVQGLNRRGTLAFKSNGPATVASAALATININNAAAAAAVGGDDGADYAAAGEKDRLLGSGY